MKSIIIILALSLLTLTGCVDPFTNGAVTGAAIVEWADGIEKDFVIAANKVSVRTDELNEGLEAAKGAIILNPDTIATIKAMKGIEKQPAAWIALGSILLNAIWGGRALKGRETS